MKPPAERLYLERRTYRRRRMTDAVQMLPYVAALLFLLPVFWFSGVPSEEAMTSQGLIYIFAVWALLIVIAAFLSSRLTRGEDEPEPSSEDVEREP